LNVTSTSSSNVLNTGVTPTITGISPNHGTKTGGTTVTITGSGFTGATSVMFGGLPATSYTVNSNLQITATAPARTAGTFDVTVTNPSGTSTTSTADQYTYTNAQTSTVGVYRNGAFYLASSNTNDGGTVNAFSFGQSGDVPVAGDWTGSGKDTVGIFRNGTFFLASSNTNGGGTVTGFTFGTTGDVPVVWNNNGVSTVGVFRKGTFYLASSNTNGGGTVTGFTFGTTGDKPVTGIWS